MAHREAKPCDDETFSGRRWPGQPRWRRRTSRAAQAQRVLKFLPQADLATLDPVWTTADVTRNHAHLVFDTLYGQDNNFQPQPQMAAGHTVGADGRQWDITLRDGLKFHDGTPVLARDCVASIQRWWQRDGFGGVLRAATDEVSAPSDKQIRFRLKKPFPLLADALAVTTNMCCIMPERLAQTDAMKQVTEMVGSGPYRFVAAERVAGSRVVYERFADYVPRTRRPGRDDRGAEDGALRSGGMVRGARSCDQVRRDARRRVRLVGEPDDRPARHAEGPAGSDHGGEGPLRLDRHHAVQLPVSAVRQSGDPPHRAVGDRSARVHGRGGRRRSRS